ncbi:ATP-dependent DNA helicase RecG [Allohahella marinimesophila]|uniref:ATP-dependent DNA helicase RecG n=1 Tax=Allohahella marinimesophila TaxID=1054972 RepID=A0ABP7P9W0_9GAMM
MSQGASRVAHPSEQAIEQPVDCLKGIGPALSEKLALAGIVTVRDLLLHLPLRYEDRTRVVPIASLKIGRGCRICCTVVSAQSEQGRRPSLFVRVQDATGTCGLRFYYPSAALRNLYLPGVLLDLFGEPRPGRNGVEFYHPEVMPEGTPDAGEDDGAEEAGGSRALMAGLNTPRLTAVYPALAGLAQTQLRQLIVQSLGLLRSATLIEHLPRPQGALTAPEKTVLHCGLSQALHIVHQPERLAMAEDDAPEAVRADRSPIELAQDRLSLEELLAHHLSLLRLRKQMKSRQGFVVDGKPRLSQQLQATLPFRLTGAQQRVMQEIRADLATGQPMQRLLQGDVGSGKTLVAALSALDCIDSGLQVALMAPTEVLAEQHIDSFRSWCQPLGVSVQLLTGSMRGAEKKAVKALIASGSAQIVIGTHALFQKDVLFRQLGLIIIDEQHRFGVGQRLALKDKGRQPHQLVMTATPIPRTLAMSIYADLDTSVIDELPPGRQIIQTSVVPSKRREDLIERIAHALSEGAQVYWVCTLVAESEAIESQAAESTATMLAAALPGFSVGLVHGQMKSDAKRMVMQHFKSGEIQLLVATTVIEVGVNVPNASLMVIENSERLGLAQLHQLRGRVGRGAKQSYCLLVYDAPLSQLAKQRLQTMRESHDGFYIAEKDLEIRGPGEVLGVRQAGSLNFRIADLQRDQHLLPLVKKLAAAATPALESELSTRWLQHRMQFVEV